MIIILIQCPECENQASDKAISCPHCGYPLNVKQIQKTVKKYTNKRRRLPNGFGQITEIKNKNLRNSFRVMVTVDKDVNGRPIAKLLKPQSYFRTYNDAYAALLEYNKNPLDIDKCVTMKELYDKWSVDYFKTLNADSSIKNIKNTWLYCSSIYDMQVSEVRVRHIKSCIDESKKIYKGKELYATASIKSRIKSVFNILLDYAVEYEIIDKNYSRAFKTPDKIIKEESDNKQSHIPFTDEEFNKLWEHVDTIPYVDIILIQSYTGFRPQELGLLELENIDLENNTITGGIKTESGTNRIVPIHSKIRYLIDRKYKEALSADSKYLINIINGYGGPSSTKMTYGKYRYRFIKIIEELEINPEHRCHDPRMHFITMAKKYKVDEYAIKYIVGHSISDITEKVYTKRNINWLKEEIENIK